MSAILTTSCAERIRHCYPGRDNHVGKDQVVHLGSRRPASHLLTDKGIWNEFTGNLKQNYADLTGDDLHFAVDKEDELLSRLQKPTGKTKEALREFIQDI